MSFNVQSEVGQLCQVIVHRPGLELSRLTPQNIGPRCMTCPIERDLA
jgi:arginine deiminase